MGWHTGQYAVSENHLGTDGLRVEYVGDECPCAIGERDQGDSPGFEHRFESGCHHAGIPRAPTQCPDQAAGTAAGLFGQGYLVENFIGHGVVTLADVAAARGHRREQADQLQLFGGRRIEECSQTPDFCLEDAVVSLQGLLVQGRIGQDTGSVDQPGDGPEVGTHAIEQRAQFDGIPNVGRGVADPGSGRGQCREGGAHFAVGQMPRTCCSSCLGVSLSPCAAALVSKARLSSASVVSPRTAGGSSPSAVRPISTKLA